MMAVLEQTDRVDHVPVEALITENRQLVFTLQLEPTKMEQGLRQRQRLAQIVYELHCLRVYSLKPLPKILHRLLKASQKFAPGGSPSKNY